MEIYITFAHEIGQENSISINSMKQNYKVTISIELIGTEKPSFSTLASTTLIPHAKERSQR